MISRFNFIETPADYPVETLCGAVSEGLALPQKRLHSRFFYDSRGSDLFEQICRLPEYYVTRTEQSILTSYCSQMVEAVGVDVMLIEFGSGSSMKTRLLMQELIRRQHSLHYVPIDISGQFLYQSCQNLMKQYPALSVTGIAAEYYAGIRALPDHKGPRLILFLGSNIGNFERADAISFLSQIRGRMKSRDRILIGVDLIKDRKVLTAAYNDATGVTAKFNKNLLERINRELGGQFDVDQFNHEAPYCEYDSRIEMHLRSRKKQSVTISYLEKDYLFEKGESVHTENSHKYGLESFATLCTESNLKIQERWLDEREWFAVLLLEPMDEREGADVSAGSDEKWIRTAERENSRIDL